LRQKEIASVADVSTEALGAKIDVDLKMTSDRAVKAGKEMYISKLAGGRRSSASAADKLHVFSSGHECLRQGQ
jgi:hypothetical protein